MSVFGSTLEEIGRRVPGTRLAMILGVDGIPVEKIAEGDEATLETIAAEYTTLLRASVSAGDDTGLGELSELSVVTEGMTAVLVGITPDYYIFGAFEPDTEVGRARFAVRLAALSLRAEFA